MKVLELIEDQGGVETLVDKLKKLGQPVGLTTVSVWKNRKVVPDYVWIALMLDNRKLDPRKYGWKPKAAGKKKVRK